MKFWLQHCISELLNISRSIFIRLDYLLLLSGMRQVFALRFDIRSNRGITIGENFSYLSYEEPIILLATLAQGMNHCFSSGPCSR